MKNRNSNAIPQLLFPKMNCTHTHTRSNACRFRRNWCLFAPFPNEAASSFCCCCCLLLFYLSHFRVFIGPIIISSSSICYYHLFLYLAAHTYATQVISDMCAREILLYAPYLVDSLNCVTSFVWIYLFDSEIIRARQCHYNVNNVCIRVKWFSFKINHHHSHCHSIFFLALILLFNAYCLVLTG